MIQLREDVGWLRPFHLQQAILGHGVDDDDALTLTVPAHLVLGGRGEAVSQELRAVMDVDVALVHIHHDGGAVLLLL